MSNAELLVRGSPAGGQSGIAAAGLLLRKVVAAARYGIVSMRRFEVLERDVSTPIPGTVQDSALVYRLCGPDDCDAFREIGDRWKALKRHFQDRLDRGQVCVGCFDGRRGVGYIWLAHGPEEDRSAGLRIVPTPDQSYAFDLFVLPEYRRYQVGSALIRSWLLHARDLGKKSAVGIVLDTNAPMLMLTRAMYGFKRTRRITSVQVLGRWGFVLSER